MCIRDRHIAAEEAVLLCCDAVLCSAVPRAICAGLGLGLELELELNLEL